MQTPTIYIGPYIQMAAQQTVTVLVKADLSKCPQCGYRNHGRFCSDCGQPLLQQEESIIQTTHDLLAYLDKMGYYPDDSFWIPPDDSDSDILLPTDYRFDDCYTDGSFDTIIKVDAINEPIHELTNMFNKEYTVWMDIFDKHGILYDVHYGVVVYYDE